MKYFTPELWASWNEPGYTPPPAEKDPFVLYRQELERLRDRVPADVFSFFSEADVHDGELLDFTIIDGNRPAPLGEPKRRWKLRGQHPVAVTLRVLDAWDRLVWNLRYTGIRRVEVKFSADERGRGFDDWGYHELTDAGGGFLRHEILFSSDSILLVEFLHIEVTRIQARGTAER